MDPEERFQLQRAWSGRALALTRELLPLMEPVAGFTGWKADELVTVGMLMTAAARSTESVLLLTTYGQLWDAEIVLRSVFEASLKFVYLLEAREKFQVRHDEYARQCLEIALLKDHQKAEDLLAVVSDPDGDENRPIRDRKLSEAKRGEFQERYPRPRKRELEQKWGFTGLLRALARVDAPGFKELTTLAWGYSLMSHLQHADYVGASLPFDRHERTPEREEALHIAHLARLIGDTMTCIFVRLAVAYRFVGHEAGPVIAAAGRMNELRDSFGDAYGSWSGVEYGKP